jgi:hypothetical protein
MVTEDWGKQTGNANPAESLASQDIYDATNYDDEVCRSVLFSVTRVAEPRM